MNFRIGANTSKQKQFNNIGKCVAYKACQYVS